MQTAHVTIRNEGTTLLPSEWKRFAFFNHFASSWTTCECRSFLSRRTIVPAQKPIYRCAHSGGYALASVDASAEIGFYGLSICICPSSTQRFAARSRRRKQLDIYICIFNGEKYICGLAWKTNGDAGVIFIRESIKNPRLVYVNPGTLPEKRAPSVYRSRLAKNLTFLDQYLPFTREHVSSCSRAPRC